MVLKVPFFLQIEILILFTFVRHSADSAYLQNDIFVIGIDDVPGFKITYFWQTCRFTPLPNLLLWWKPQPTARKQNAQFTKQMMAT